MPALLALCLLLGADAASSEPAKWPDRPTHLVAPFPPGSLVDITLRILQPKFAARLGQQLVIAVAAVRSSSQPGSLFSVAVRCILS